MDQRSLACSGVCARRYGGADVASRARRCALVRLAQKQFHLAYFKWSFLTFSNRSALNVEYQSC
jgi:hypothetical protein